MRTRYTVLFASLIVFLLGILVMPVQLTNAKEETKKHSSIANKGTQKDPLRALYDDKVRFQMLSGAAQTVLEQKFGKKVRGPSHAIPHSKQNNRPASPNIPTNVLVNDPTADSTQQDTQSETTIVLAGPNIAVGYNDSGSFIGGAHFTGFSYSTDSGSSFVDGGKLPDDPTGEGDAGDPSMARDNTTGRIYFATLGFNTLSKLQIFRSDDNGVTWSVPVGAGNVGGGSQQDKELITVDNFSGAGQGNIYLTWRSFGDGVYMVRSTDAGDTWSAGLKVADQGSFNVQGPYPVVTPDHALHIFWHDQSAGFGTPALIKTSKSTDQGVTFDSAVLVATLMTTGVNGDLGLNGGFRSNAFPHVAANPANGDIYVAWNDDVPGADAADVFYNASTDGGATWSTPTDISTLLGTTTNDDWQPAIAITPDGTQAFVGWYDRELDPSNNLIDWFGAVANTAPGVLNFQPQQRLSDTSFPVVIGQDPVINTVYMGDYDTAVADNGFIHTVWGDNRLPDNFFANQPDVRYAKIALGPTGTLQGTITDANTTNPIQGATVQADGNQTTTDANGFYSMILAVGTYNVTASAYGYFSQTVNGVVISDSQTTVQDFALLPAPVVTVTGTVTDGSGHGWPLYARLDISPFPGSPIFTNPVSGTYSVDLVQDQPYTFTVSAVSGGYTPEVRAVTPPSGGSTEDFALLVDPSSCNAPGYGFVGGIFEGFEGGGLPAGWTNIDNQGTGQVWQFDDPCNRGNLTGGTGGFAIIDSDCYGPSGFQDTELRTPVLDFSSQSSVSLEFDSDFLWYLFDLDEICDVDVSTDGGATWPNNVLRYQGGSVRGPHHENIDISGIAGNQSNVMVRFHYYQANFEFWWQIDNVKIGTQCLPIPGGLLVGNTFDLNAGTGLNGVKVQSDNAPTENTLSFATPQDPNVDDGFYILFSSLTGAQPFTASKANYGDDTQNPTIVADAVVVQDFHLGAGFLDPNPDSFDVTVPLGTTLDANLDMNNTGTASADFELQEGNGLTAGPHAAKAKGAPVKLIKGHFTAGSFAGNGPHKGKDAGIKGKDGENKKARKVRRHSPNDPPWTDIADYPSAIMDNSCAEIDGLIYCVGGFDGGSILNTGNVYDPASDSWAPIASMTSQREKPAAVAIDGKLYVTAGWDGVGNTNSSLEIYDPSTDSWSSGSSKITALGGGTSAVNLDGKFVVIGGCDSGSCGFTDVQSYDPASDSWSSLAAYPEATSWLGCGVIGGSIYCTGGTAGSGTSQHSYVYDPATDTWSPIADLPIDLWAMGFTVSDDLLYVSGGVTNGFSTITNQGFSYDPSSDTWTAIANSNNVVYRGGSACGFYRVGGSIGGFSPIPAGEVLPGLTNCGAAADVVWLSENPVSGTVPAGGTVPVTITFDANQVSQPGDYFAHLKVKENTPYTVPDIQITMHVPLPADWGTLNGTVTGLGRCDAAGNPLNKATVFVDTGGTDYTLETDSSGHYQVSFPAVDSPVIITVSAAGYVGQTRSGVVITAGQTTTEDFALRLDAPCGSKSPASFDVTLPAGASQTLPLTITNAGAGVLTFNIQETTFPLPPAKPFKAQGKAKPIKQAVSGPSSIRTMSSAKKGDTKLPARPDTSWFFGAPAPDGRVRYAHAQCDNAPNKFYVISGVDGGFSTSTDNSVYDATTNTWTALAPIPTAQEGPTGTCYQNKIYVMGGGGTNQFFIYDIPTDTWSTGANLPRNVEGAAAAGWSGKIYLIAGDDDFFPGSGVSGEVDIYDIATDTWTGTGASAPVPTSNMGYFQAGPLVYLVGGWDAGSPSANVSASQRYDITIDTWTTGPSLNFPRADLGVVATDTALYAMGGDADGGGFFDSSGTVERLDYSTWPGGAWADFGDDLADPVAANQGGFCTEALHIFNSIGEIWTVGGLNQNFNITGNNAFHPINEHCFTIFTDVPWVSESPTSGSVPADSALDVNVTFDATGLTPGNTYTASLVIDTNDPGASQFVVPLTLHVSTCLFCDYFNDGVVAANWTYTPGIGSWAEANDLLSSSPTKKATAIATPAFGGCQLCSVESSMSSSVGRPEAAGSSRLWLYGWFIDKHNVIELVLKPGSDKVVIRQRVGGSIVKKQSVAFTINPNTFYDVKMTNNGATIVVNIDGTDIMTFTPQGTVPSGTVGLGVKASTGSFDFIVVN